jgi:hypothetical protein
MVTAMPVGNKGPLDSLLGGISHKLESMSDGIKGSFFFLPPKGDSCKAIKLMSFGEGFLTTEKAALHFNAMSFSTVPFPPTVCCDTMELNSRAAEITVKEKWEIKRHQLQEKVFYFLSKEENKIAINKTDRSKMLVPGGERQRCLLCGK